MRGLIPNNAAKNGATIARQELLIPYPQYANNGFTLNNISIGRQRYQGLQTKFTKRYSYGVVFNATYQFIKVTETASLLNNQDYNFADPQSSKFEKRSAGQIDIPHKFAIAGSWDLPVGKGMPWGSNMGRAGNAILGGWQMNFDVTYQSGWVPDYPNAKQVKDGTGSLGSGATFGRYFDTSLWDTAAGTRVAAQEPFTLRDFPTRFSGVRQPGYRNWDASLAKFLPITEKMKLQFRMEMINAFNRPWYANLAAGATDVSRPTFGQLDPTQRNLPRFVKLALNLVL